MQSRHCQDVDQSRVLHHAVEGLLQPLRLSKQDALHQSQHRRAVERLGGAAQLLLYRRISLFDPLHARLRPSAEKNPMAAQAVTFFHPPLCRKGKGIPRLCRRFLQAVQQAAQSIRQTLCFLQADLIPAAVIGDLCLLDRSQRS